jgi:hypothetical protein
LGHQNPQIKFTRTLRPKQKRTYKNKMKFNLHTSRKFSSAVAAPSSKGVNYFLDR